jgi:hypothetical protein
MRNNSSGAENQQGRLDAKWIVGFTDGEGCFSVSFVKNESMKFGYQVFVEFVITQGAKSRKTLEEIKNFFGCGNIYRNTRHDNHREDVFRYCVRANDDLSKIIVPFFRKFPLVTVKNDDFVVWAEITEMIEKMST